MVREMSDNTPDIQPNGYRFGHAEATALALEALLAEHGIAIRPNSALEQATLNIFDVLYRRAPEKPEAREDIRLTFKHLIGLTELGGLLLSVRQHPSFPQLGKHLHLLNEGQALQNMPSSQLDAATNKVFELFVATLAMHCGKDVELDDPEKSRGDNPDVLATIDGRRWGLACKVLHSLHPESFIQNLEKGISQIERSPADVGIVVFSLKNVIDQDRYWKILNEKEWRTGAAPIFSAFLNPDKPFQLLLRETQEIGVRLRNRAGDQYLTSVFDGKKSLPGYLLWSHTVSGVVIGGQPVPTSVRLMNLQTMTPISGPDLKVLNCLHNAAFVGQSSTSPTSQ
jgi:hypothetical protein